MAEIFIVSDVNVHFSGNDEARSSLFETDVVIQKSENHKCGRCWRLLPEVPEDGGLCARCAEVVEEMDQPA